MKRLLPAHNSAVSDPKLLLELNYAAVEVRAGRVRGREANGRVEFAFGPFSFITSRAALDGAAGPADVGGSGLAPTAPSR